MSGEDATGYLDISELRCFACAGPWSAPTGWVISRDLRVYYCGRCARVFATFFKERMRSMSRPGRDFALAAATSIRPPL